MGVCVLAVPVGGWMGWWVDRMGAQRRCVGGTLISHVLILSHYGLRCSL